MHSTERPSCFYVFKMKPVCFGAEVHVCYMMRIFLFTEDIYDNADAECFIPYIKIRFAGCII